MSIVLFAIIGAAINAGIGYWICFGVYCLLRAASFVVKFMQAASDN